MRYQKKEIGLSIIEDINKIKKMFFKNISERTQFNHQPFLGKKLKDFSFCLVTVTESHVLVGEREKQINK
jgi:hypothetical protein